MGAVLGPGVLVEACWWQWGLGGDVVSNGGLVVVAAWWLWCASSGP